MESKPAVQGTALVQWHRFWSAHLPIDACCTRSGPCTTGSDPGVPIFQSMPAVQGAALVQRALIWLSYCTVSFPYRKQRLAEGSSTDVQFQSQHEAIRERPSSNRCPLYKGRPLYSRQRSWNVNRPIDGRCTRGGPCTVAIERGMLIVSLLWLKKN